MPVAAAAAADVAILVANKRRTSRPATASQCHPRAASLVH